MPGRFCLQGLKRVALELCATGTVQVCGQAVPSQCDPYVTGHVTREFDASGVDSLSGMTGDFSHVIIPADFRCSEF